MSEAAKQLLGRIEAIDAAAVGNQRRVEAYQHMVDELKDAEGTASSPDGLVSVVAGPNGSVSSITFSDKVRETTPDALSAIVMHTLAEARASAARLQAEVVRRGLGDTELLDRVLDSDEQLFGDQRPRDPGPAPKPARKSRAEDDQLFEDFSVYNSFDGERNR
jgi:DNA-binding protein YbaB